MTLAPPSTVDGTAWSPAQVRRLVLVVSVVAGTARNRRRATTDRRSARRRRDRRRRRRRRHVVGRGRPALGRRARHPGRRAHLVLDRRNRPRRRRRGRRVPAPGRPRAALPSLNAALIGVAMNIAARSQLDVFLGASTLVAVALGGYVAAVGFLRRTQRSRRAVAIVGARQSSSRSSPPSPRRLRVPRRRRPARPATPRPKPD